MDLQFFSLKNVSVKMMGVVEGKLDCLFGDFNIFPSLLLLL